MSISSDALSCASSVLSLQDDKSSKDKEELYHLTRYKPVWKQYADVVIDLTQVRSVTSW